MPYYVREHAANSLYLEAKSRIQDPVYGCVGIISKLYQQIHETEIELAKTQTQIAFHKLQNQQFEDGTNLKFLMPQSNSMEKFQWPNQTPNWFN